MVSVVPGGVDQLLSQQTAEALDRANRSLQLLMAESQSVQDEISILVANGARYSDQNLADELTLKTGCTAQTINQMALNRAHNHSDKEMLQTVHMLTHLVERDMAGLRMMRCLLVSPNTH